MPIFYWPYVFLQMRLSRVAKLERVDPCQKKFYLSYATIAQSVLLDKAQNVWAHSISIECYLFVFSFQRCKSAVIQQKSKS